MASRTNTSIVLVERPQGEIIPGQTFQKRTGPAPTENDLKDGQFLIETLCYGIDAAMRTLLEEKRNYTTTLPIGSVQVAVTLSRVLASKSTKVKAGHLVISMSGWQEFAVISETDVWFPVPHPLPSGARATDYLGLFGISGWTAHVGLSKFGHVKPGDTVVVTSAAGGTGSIVGQIARIQGAGKVIGITGTDEKCKWLTDVAGFDVTLNYNDPDFDRKFEEATPDLIDVFWDNVGGHVLDLALERATNYARFVMCGMIRSYNALDHRETMTNLPYIVYKRIKMNGFIVLDHLQEVGAATKELAQWLAEGKIQGWEQIIEGTLDDFEKAWQMLYSGGNTDILTKCFLILFLSIAGAVLTSVPLNQVIEDIICHGGTAAPDPRCKDPDVQAELSLIQGWDATLSLIPSLLSAVPYGIAAEKYGHQKVLALSLVGVLLSNGFTSLICSLSSIFPIRAIWLSSLFIFIGGGPTVYGAMVFSYANAVSSEVERSTTFLWLGATMFVGEMVSSPLVLLAMKAGPWVSILAGLMLLASSPLIALTLPDIRHLNTAAKPPDDSSNDDDTDINTPASQAKLLTTLCTHLTSSLDQFLDCGRFILSQHPKLALLLLSILFTTLGKMAQLLMMQYASTKYGWSWSQAGLLLSIQAFTSLLLLILILPSLSHLLVTKLHISPLVKDLWFARAIILAMVLGAFGMALASTSLPFMASVVLFSVGTSYNLVCRSLLSAISQGQHIAMLYTAIGFLETGGALIAGPFLAAMYRIGLNWGGVWLGLPFISAGIMFAFAGVVLGVVRFREAGDESATSEQQEGNDA
ncbi:Putative NADP-dependent oxidoreductase YfmJ [Cladobotryum mycophilum]|uniref:NADP-dependent oxidoreductase YfmJ n=1 Tax=Cladobotryum mycophilum TaxID=491253 RepID=A0ABR0T2Q3_9HYPO